MARILVADDRAASRELIRSMVEGAGHEADEAENGAEALSAVVKNPPDVSSQNKSSSWCTTRTDRSRHSVLPVHSDSRKEASANQA